MTNFKQARNNGKRGFNQKDHNRPLGQQCDYNKKLEGAGFTRTDWNKWAYTWSGKFPIFQLAPGVVEGSAGLVARYAPADKEILFPYGTSPADIAAQLNDEILTIMCHDADVDDPPLNWRPLVANGQEIGPEVAF